MSRRELNENTKMNKGKDFTFNRGWNEMKRTKQYTEHCPYMLFIITS